MITGEADLKSSSPGKTVSRRASASGTTGIFDQHFLAAAAQQPPAQRRPRPPGIIGVGIDEATAAIVRNGQIEVVGRSAVVVFDGRKAKVEKTAAGGVVAGTGVITSVLRQGMTLSLK